nr:glycosyltransferase family 2 protein [Pedobacter panaciterrae]
MFISIITPAYNRAETLHRCYESLREQSFSNFEWIIVDDGSTDETSQTVSAWQSESSLNIVYVQKPNGGKPSAVNHGVKIAKGEMCAIVDSDDGLCHDGLKTLVNAWETLAPDQRDTHWCVCALVEDSVTKQVVGDLFPSDLITITGGEFQFKYKITGDKFGLMRTALLKNNPYPEAVGYKFVPESYIWNRLGRQYKYICINTVVLTYYMPIGSGIGNLSGKANRIRNAKGLIMCEVDVVNKDLPHWFFNAPIFFFKRAAQLSRYGIHSASLLRQYMSLESIWGKMIVLVSFPLGFTLYLGDKLWFKYYYSPIKAKLLRDTVS